MIDEKVAIITGASHGIGAGLVAAYRDAGFKVVASSLSIEHSTDSNVLNVAGDISNPKTADLIMSEGVDKFGRLDTLVNNAGAYISKPFTQYTQADYDLMLSTNLAGFFHITQRARACDGGPRVGSYREHHGDGSRTTRQRCSGGVSIVG